MEHNIFVADTSIFTEPSNFHNYGKTELLALINVLQMAKNNNYVIYITQSCWYELMNHNILGKLDKKQANIEEKKILASSHLRIRSPDLINMQINASIFADFVIENRKRVDDALVYVVKMVKEAYHEIPQKREKNKEDPIAPFINKTRNGHRHHTRENFLDSGADFETLMLAKELNACLLTSDHGMLTWAKKFGLEIMSPALLPFFSLNDKETILDQEQEQQQQHQQQQQKSESNHQNNNFKSLLYRMDNSNSNSNNNNNNDNQTRNYRRNFNNSNNSNSKHYKTKRKRECKLVVKSTGPVGSNGAEDVEDVEDFDIVSETPKTSSSSSLSSTLSSTNAYFPTVKKRLKSIVVVS